MPVHYNIIPADKNQNIPPAMTKIDVKAGAKKLAPAVKKALESARKADDKFAKWFCPKGAEGHDEVQKLVVNLLTNMSEFLDKTTNTVNIKLMAKDADSSLYAYVWPDLGRSNKAGQWFVYLGPCIVKKEAGVKDIFLLTLAHEMSHHFGTNAQKEYQKEKYAAACKTLPASDPVYAANNADNYGYFIEHCAQ